MVLGALSLRRQRRTLLDMEALESRGPSETVLLERLDENGQPVYASVGAGASEGEEDEGTKRAGWGFTYASKHAW